MNKFTERESDAALVLRRIAVTLAGYYAKPDDAAPATLALLMKACQQEAKAQGLENHLIFKGEEE